MNSVARFGRFAHFNTDVKPMKTSDVFVLQGSAPGLSKKVCRKDSPCPPLVFLYACLGIHRYNFLKGRKFEVSRVKKYVNSTTTAARSYYITLNAKEPAGQSSTFQIKVSQSTVGKFILSCTVARIQGETTDDIETSAVYIHAKGVYLHHLPDWPQQNPFEIYSPVKKESELEDKDKDWIHLYLQLAVAMSDMKWYARNPKDFLDDLKIVEVVAATQEGINAKSATLFIRYRDLYRAQLGLNDDDVDRVVIVRRLFDEENGFFCLEGQIRNFDQVLYNTKIADEEASGGLTS